MNLVITLDYLDCCLLWIWVVGYDFVLWFGLCWMGCLGVWVSIVAREPLWFNVLSWRLVLCVGFRLDVCWVVVY